MLAFSRARRALCRWDPLMFAMLYLPDSVARGEKGFADSHLQMCRDAREWALLRRQGGPLTETSRPRFAYLAPRDSGKSTWVFKILPLWALVFGHAKFAACFADSGTQASEHLEGIRAEIESNRLLREDAPALCTPHTRRGVVTGDSKYEYRSRSGIIKARGIDSAVLGMKEGNIRPDLICLDDIEKGESAYSAAQARKRLRTVQDVIFPLRLNATVLMAGTTTMAGSVMDDLARHAAGADDETNAWVASEKIAVSYSPALRPDQSGDGLVSVWPGKWSAEWLMAERLRSPRSYAKNFDNKPLDETGIYFDPDDFQRGIVAPTSFALLSVDPAVSKKSTSDWTGLAVISYSKSSDRFGLRYATKVRMSGKQLRARVETLLARFPDITAVLIETNQGGDLWTDDDGVFHGLPRVKVLTVHQKLAKEARAELASAEFQNHKVFIEPPDGLPEAERDLAAFPGVLHDDLVDAITSGIIEIRKRVRADRRNNAGISAAASARGIVVSRASYVRLRAR
jgi:phage terminase large subunit-like protein